MILPFCLATALAGGCTVITRDGRIVDTITEVNPNADFSAQDGARKNPESYVQGITARIHNQTGLHVHPYYHDGGAHRYGGENDADLFLVYNDVGEI